MLKAPKTMCNAGEKTQKLGNQVVQSINLHRMLHEEIAVPSSENFKSTRCKTSKKGGIIEEFDGECKKAPRYIRAPLGYRLSCSLAPTSSIHI